MRRALGREVTHLHHLLNVYFDDCRVGVGLHRHCPVIDHGRLGVRRRGRTGVLLKWARNQKGMGHIEVRGKEGEEGGAVGFREKNKLLLRGEQGGFKG